MKILPITNYNNYNIVKNNPKQNRIGTTNPAQNYWVAFGNAQKMSDIFIHQLRQPKRLADLERFSKVFNDVTFSIADELKELGVSFNKAYCSHSPIKSPESTVSKIVRSGSMDVPDQIRTTLFCNNSYDMSVLKNILDAYKSRDFVLAPLEVPVAKMIEQGYAPTKAELKKGVVELKDIDIRLDKDKITKFVPEYNGYISKPQSSGYEDIQIRFINLNDKKSNQTKHELIILFGDNYAKAKYYESEMIYKFTRQLDELKFYRNTKSEGLKKRTGEYIDAIKTKLNLGISQKLFASANSLDVKNIDNEMLINVFEQEIKELGKYFSKLREKGHTYYEIAEQRAKTPARLKKIKKDHEADSKMLAEIRKNLEESINFFNEKKYFKNLSDIFEKKPQKNA